MSMKLEDININIPFTKSDGTVLINAKDWQDNTTQLVQAYNFKGEHTISNINKVLKTNYSEEIYDNEVLEGDLVFISKQASRVSYLKPFKFPNVEGEFANVHLLQLIGKFKDGEVSYDSFIPLYNKVFMKKLEVSSDSILDLGDSDKTIIGEVLKIGTNGFDENWNKTELQVKVGQKVLVRDNITTEITLDGEDYIATEDNMCVGYFNGEIKVDNLTLYNNRILLEKVEDTNIEGSSLLVKPNSSNNSVSDIDEFYTDNRFKVIKTGVGVNVGVNDKVIVSEDFLNYVTIEGIKYYLLEGTKYIYATYK